MAQEENGSSMNVRVPIGALAGALLVAAALIAYMRSGDSSEEATQGPVQRLRPGKNVRRKVFLTTLIAMIENDQTRKIVVAVLKGLAKRS